MTLENRDILRGGEAMQETSHDKTTGQLTELFESVLSKRPLIVASNRGPVEHQMTPDGRPEARRGSGSVVTAFSHLTQLTLHDNSAHVGKQVK